MPTILLVEDDVPLAEMIELLLKAGGYAVVKECNAEQALYRMRSEVPDLVLADLNLPGLSGTEMCRILRRAPRTAMLPFVLLTVRNELASKLHGFSSGADDYITKPFQNSELLARIAARLRQPEPGADDEAPIALKGLIVDPGRRRAALEGRVLALRRKEFDLLTLLLRSGGRVLTHEYLRNALWTDGTLVTTNTLSTHVKNLRRKLGPIGDLVETIVGVGYRLRETP